MIVIGEADTIESEPQICCYGNHVGFESAAGGTTKPYRKCGWNGMFRGMLMREWEGDKDDPKTKQKIIHNINACPDDIDRDGKVIWMICHPGKPYRTFSESPATCRSALLCQKVSVKPLEIPKLDRNFCHVIGEADTIESEPQICCYGNHVGFESAAGGTTKPYRKCGWNGMFRGMLMREWEGDKDDPKTKQKIIHNINACPDDIDRDGKVIWMKFQKVARTPAKTGDEDEDYGQGDGVKFQTEWLPVEGTPREFFIHLRACIDRYFPHKYEVRLSERVDYNAQQAFMIDPVIREDCPEEYKDVVSEVCDFSTDIQGKRAKDTTCSFPEMHKLEIHHLTYNPH